MKVKIDNAEAAVTRVEKLIRSWERYVIDGSWKEVGVSPSAIWAITAALNGTTSDVEREAYVAEHGEPTVRW